MIIADALTRIREDRTMTEPTPTPAPDVLEQSDELQADEQLWIMFVPPATQDNYTQIARDQAAVRDVEVGQVLHEMADQWDQLHQRQPLDGYDHLAQWARQHDPAAAAGPSGLTVLQARALESARRDPYQAVIGDQALVAEAVAAQQVQDAQVAGVTAAPSVDPSSGMLPNAGPLPTPTDVQVGDPAVAEQQQAAAEQRDDGGTAGDTTPPPPTPDATSTAAPASDTPSTPPPSTPKGKNGGGSSSGTDTPSS
jgi:hypothetical protein